ncbi:MAG: TonB-dependent receptor [Arcobacter sp.]|jgi:outer membrane receptor for ferrienterochelin and colicins|uniref:TonB-dependent receptor domain-containing protein n=1 Tax=Arcobacter sp. TaxID=1872629 RepID=UPI002588E55F|nr:TonB-dependent receptor [Arcobacter sp.]MDD3009129.1 TonB-dependent receptor [Arcobacter sp.]MDX9814886.1 TonB-dependent receptor [Sulfurimonadaceae bacterium]MDY3203665.1 TonB-dependent receptor [Arcobacter sp.]
MKLKIASSVAALLVAQASVLADDTTKLEEITVTTAAGYEQKLVDAPASISVITQEDLAKKPYANLLDAVKDIEGVDIGETTDKSGQGTVSMRGMGADYTLVLIDGKKQNNNGDIYPNNFGGLQFANIPPLAMIERIEVVRGPMSTLYGADAMGGVINIITKKVSKEWTGSISHSKTFQTDNSWGNKDTTDVSLMGPLIKDKLGLSLRGSFYDNEKSNPKWAKATYNGIDVSKSNDSFGGNGKTMDNQNWTFGTGLTFTPNDAHTIKADFDVSKQKYDNTEGSVGTVDSYETIYKNQRVGYAPIQRMQREQYSLSWEAAWDLGKSTVGVHHIESENLGRSLPLSADERLYIKNNKAGWGSLAGAMNDPNFVDLMPRPKRTLESTNTTYSAKYELPLNTHFLVVGTEYLDAQMKDGVFGMSEGKSNGKKEYGQYSVFVEDSWNIIDPLTLTFGGRYDKHEDFGSHISPRVYAIYSLTDDWTLKGGVATGYKTPKTSDLQEGITGFGGQGTSPMIGNPDLKPEESLSKEIAVYYEHPNKHNFNVTLFQNDFKDKIESTDITASAGSQWEAVSSGYGTLKQKQNVGEAEILGLEVAGKYFILDDLSIKANWTWMDSEIESDDPLQNGKPLRSSPKHMYNATLDYQATAKLNTYLQYSGEVDRFKQRYTTSTASLKDIYYKDYSVWNAGTSYKVDKNLTINGRINNLFDKDFMEYSAIDRVGTTNYYEDYSNIGAGRNFWLSANYTF